MRIDKCLYICHNREDVIFLQKELFKNGVSWATTYSGEKNKIDGFEEKYVSSVDYPVYMGCWKGHISWTTSKGIEYSLKNLYIGWCLIDVNILKRKEKLNKINEK